jgi:hypothetical protein
MAQGLAFQGFLLLLLSWTMARELKRNPGGGFFRPVLLGFAPVLLLSLWSFGSIQRMSGADLLKAQESVAAFAKAMAGGQASAISDADYKAFSQLSLRIQPAMVCVFWLGMLTLSAFGLRAWLRRRGLKLAERPLSRWQAPDPLIWVLLLPGALLALDQRHWLGQVESWISDASLNVLVVMAAVYLFQGLMVVLERAMRIGVPRFVGAMLLFSALLISSLPQGRGLGLGLLALGLLDIWCDFRNLTSKQVSEKE